ncbi:FUSC family protein [Streptomyces sp. M41]|uniref:FUSC family protein n=1 Tax=Streptomyces sp. M41 TaxID=3059412 RepID=UPI00374D5689
MPVRASSPDRVQAARRAVRISVAAAAGFYPAVYLLDSPVLALYAFFTPIALGILSPLPGSGRDRARVVVHVLPVAVALTALGTALAVATGPAVAGMVLVGFVMSFGAACGPGPAGATPGLQLFYILACFPPYLPDTLPERLAGVLLGGALLVLCELLLLPAPPEVSYRERVAAALEVAARAARASACGATAEPGLVHELRAAGQSLRLSRLPPAVRPTGAGRTDRALAHTGGATRRLVDQLARAAEHPSPTPAPDGVSAPLLSAIAAECVAMAANLRGRRPVPGPEALEEVVQQFLVARGQAAAGRAPPSLPVLRRQSAVLAEAASAVTARAALSVALGGRRGVRGLPSEQLWYAGPPAADLWLRRLTGNLTQRSVVFQNAVRTALGLGVARLVAGSLDLSHGFWVLLAVLTLGRTTAGATWSAVRLAVTGTFAGALTAGALILGVGEATDVYAALLVPLMLLAFTVGPVAGIAWAQGLFTLVVSTAFAQLVPVTWQLGETRLVDVLTGCCIGLLCGVVAWPAGASTEVRRGMARLLLEAAPLVPATAAAVLPARTTTASSTPGRTGRAQGGTDIPPADTPPPGPPPPEPPPPEPSEADAGPPVRRSTEPPPGEGAEPPGDTEQARRQTRHRLRLAEAAYAQYRSEPQSHHEAAPDWPAALNCAIHILVGSNWLPQIAARDFDGKVPDAAAEWARAAAESTADAADRAAGFPPGGIRVPPVHIPYEVEAALTGPVLPVLVDVENWLVTLRADLRTIGDDTPPSRPAHPPSPPGHPPSLPPHPPIAPEPSPRT